MDGTLASLKVGACGGRRHRPCILDTDPPLFLSSACKRPLLRFLLASVLSWARRLAIGARSYSEPNRWQVLLAGDERRSYVRAATRPALPAPHVRRLGRVGRPFHVRCSCGRTAARVRPTSRPSSYAGRPVAASYSLTNRRPAPTNGGRSRTLCLSPSGHPAVPFGWRSGGVLPASDQTETDTFGRVVHLHDGRARFDCALPVVHFDAERERRDALGAIRCHPGSRRSGFSAIWSACRLPTGGSSYACWPRSACKKPRCGAVSSPTMGELDVLTKRVLALHIEVTKLERHELVVEGDAPTTWNGSEA